MAMYRHRNQILDHEARKFLSQSVGKRQGHAVL